MTNCLKQSEQFNINPSLIRISVAEPESGLKNLISACCLVAWGGRWALVLGQKPISKWKLLSAMQTLSVALICVFALGLATSKHIRANAVKLQGWWVWGVDGLFHFIVIR